MDFICHMDNGETLIHSAKGSTWEDHLYTEKYTKNGKTYYRYTSKSGKPTIKDYTGGATLRFYPDENGMVTNFYDARNKRASFAKRAIQSAKSFVSSASSKVYSASSSAAKKVSDFLESRKDPKRKRGVSTMKTATSTKKVDVASASRQNRTPTTLKNKKTRKLVIRPTRV